MASPPPPQQPAPRSSFYPQNHELLTQYLIPKLAGTPLPAATQHFFVEADVYADDPGTLTLPHKPGPARAFGESENWYFFCTEKPQIARDGRKPRIVGGGKGTWKSEKGEMVLDPVEGRPVGRLERFTYKPKPKEKGKKPEWLMVEFSLDQEVDQEVDGEPRIVLCKIYRSPRFLKSASKASSSASACKSKASARKRKVADLERLDFSPASLSASASKTVKTTDDSCAARRQLLFPAPNSLTDEPFLGKNSDSVTQQLRFPSPPAPIPLGEATFFDDDQFWSEFCSMGDLPSPSSLLKDPIRQQLQFRSRPTPNLSAHVDQQMVQWDQRNCIDELPAPRLCSMTAAPVPFCGGMDFCNSIAAP